MKFLKPLAFTFLLAILATSALAQQQFVGRVTEVVDGRTFIMTSAGGNIKCVLQFVEIPEPEQSLHSTVKDHLEKLILNKNILFKPQRIMNDRTVGMAMMGKVDVSRQMLRDGAAWLQPIELSGQNQYSRQTYLEMEDLARVEKRGLWSQSDLKPSWVYRQEVLQKQRLAEAEKIEAQKKKAQAERYKTEGKFEPETQNDNDKRWTNEERVKAYSDMPLWPDVERATVKPDANGIIKSEGMSSSRDRHYRFHENIGSPIVFETKGRKLDTILKIVHLNKLVGPESDLAEVYAFAVIPKKEDLKFFYKLPMSVVADGKTYKADWMQKVDVSFLGGKAETLIAYRIHTDQMTEIAFADKVQIKIGQYVSDINPAVINKMRQVYVAANVGVTKK